MKRDGLRAAVAVLALALLAGCGGQPIRPAQSPPSGAKAGEGKAAVQTERRPVPGFPAPGFAAQDVATGKSFTLEDLRGTYIVLNFWATWCPPCKVEMPELEAFQVQMKGKARVVGLGTDQGEGPEKLAAFAKSLNLTFTIGYDEGASVLSYEVVGIPTTVLIDPEGMVRARHTGPVTTALLKGWIAEADQHPAR